jgi:hypothetical protein
LKNARRIKRRLTQETQKVKCPYSEHDFLGNNSYREEGKIILKVFPPALTGDAGAGRKSPGYE